MVGEFANRETNDVPQVLDTAARRQAIQAALLEIIEKVGPELVQTLAMAFGRAIPIPSPEDAQVLLSEATRWLDEWIEEDIASSPDPQTQIALIQRRVLNTIRASRPGLTSDRDVYVYLTQKASQFSSPIKGRVNGLPWRFKVRHRLYREFLASVIDRVGFDAVESYCNLGFEPSGIIPQFQRFLNCQWFPTRLWLKPRRLTTEEINLQFKDWQSVAADWDRLTLITYGLLRIADGQQPSQRPTWAKIKSSQLDQRVSAISAVSQLQGLARPEWVTIRNALDHGGAVYNPQEHTAVFFDRNKTVTLLETDVRIQVIDMALSNLSMFLTFPLAIDVQYDQVRAWLG